MDASGVPPFKETSKWAFTIWLFNIAMEAMAYL